ncbi:MAG: hypothetical protein HOO94_08190 [Novosphingobium sp.]|uniref:hypothetical protein n=1 Tax=Novosphingobium sp. TaxID=1874826 RepID=UPI0017BEAF02|nr:hypothetical protein [Novosphingobium sp.]
MFTTFFSPTASKLDKAIALSVAAMLALNVFVLAQQMQDAPLIAASPVAQSTGQV